MEQITTTEPRPPRQTDDSIPKELERICQKASREAGVGEVQHRRGHGGRPSLVPASHGKHGLVCLPCRSREYPAGINPRFRPAPPTSRQSGYDRRPIKVVPKGLRSFDENDADEKQFSAIYPKFEGSR